MLHLSRAVVWLGGIALLAWGGAAVLVGFQMAGDVPAPCGGFVGLIATTLTIVTVQIAKREAPARHYEPAPLRLVESCDEPTIAFSSRVRAAVPLYPLVQSVAHPVGQTYRSGPRPAPPTVPRPRVPIESATTAGNERAYFKAFEEISLEVLGERDDDPPSGGAPTVQ